MSARMEKPGPKPERWGRPLTEAEAQRLAELLYKGLRALGWIERRCERPVMDPQPAFEPQGIEWERMI